MARKLGISGEPADEGSQFTAEDDNGRLDVDKSGMYIMYSQKESARDNAGHGEAPSDDEATQIAEQFLRDLDLAVPGDWADVESIRRDQGFDVVWRPSAFREAAMPIPLMLDIWVENNGVVTGMGYYWQELRPAGKYPLISEAEALKRLRNCEAHPDFRLPSTPTVDDVRIEYAGYPPDGPYQYFVPLYHFSNNIDAYATPGAWVDRLNKGLGTTDAFVLAVDDEYVEAPPSE
jgi:hypothetical protein